MQAVVVHPGTTERALRSPIAASHVKPGRIGTVLLPSPTLTAAQRIAIYQEMYPMRMRDALSSDYPAIEHFLGDDFWDFVLAYTKAHPSRRYTLNRLGDHVPAFIARQRKLKHRAFLRDLARLELAVTECFDAPEVPSIQPADIEGIPANRLGRSVLVTSPALRLVSLEWNADAYLDTLRDDNHDHASPKRVRSFVVVIRRSYSVYRFKVSHSAFAVLQDLQRGMKVGQVVERALSRRGPRRASAEDFGPWFRHWATEGLFCGLRASGQPIAKLLSIR
jgi:hypothetical protein